MSKTLHIVRGLPGEGKSTLALKIVGNDFRKVIENDDYWYLPLDSRGAYDQETGVLQRHRTKDSYHYERSMTHLAGQWCFSEAFRRLRFFDEVAVANTFILRQHVFNYVEQARSLGVNVKIHRPETQWRGDVLACFKKNIHDVPLDTLERMKKDFQPLTQAEVDVMLGVGKEE